MAGYHTVFGSLGKFEKGTIEIVDDDPRRAGGCGLYLASVVAVPHR